MNPKYRKYFEGSNEMSELPFRHLLLKLYYMETKQLQELIEKYSSSTEALDTDAEKVFGEFKQLLNSGTIRAAEKQGGEWRVNTWVKRGILLGFRLGKLRDVSINDQFRFFDKHTYPLHQFTAESN